MHEETLRAFTAAHNHAVLFDVPSRALFDVYSAKSITLGAIAEVALKKTADGAEYLVLALTDGRQLALADQGIAFPPSFKNSGPLAGMPQVVCWRDYRSVEAQVAHVLTAHPGEAVGKETLDMLMYLVAFLDGARDAGFEVDREERDVEQHLQEVEKRR